MTPIDRRNLLRGVAIAAALTPELAQAQTPTPAPAAAPAAPPPEVTRILAHYAATAELDHVPDAVRKETTRTLFNWVGSAVGGSQQNAPTHAVAALKPFCGPPQASLFGRKERLDALNAALINGISSHVLDYDDTHLRTIIHPAGPVASALLAYAEYHPVSGADLMNALLIGVEVECRMGNSVFPEHYAMGWHITGSTGVFGSAAAIGRVLGLDAQHMTWAIGLAASQPVGLKVQFGSDTKSFHPGRAAQNGMVSALLAQQGFTASEVAIEGFDGWGQALSTRHNWGEVVDGLGEHYEISLNTYKPFACGIVIHPALDAAIQLRNREHLQPDAIKSVALKVHPLVLNLTGKTDPHVGLEGKFSVYHAVAAALVTGRAGEQAFSDQAVKDPVIVALRKKVTTTIDPAIKADQVDITITLNDGRVLHQFIEHAVGSQLNPMSDAQLEDKFTGLAEGILPAAQTRALMDLCWKAWDLKDAGAIPRAGATVGA
jgi:2-methylcitrate dehydratase PrpD